MTAPGIVVVTKDVAAEAIAVAVDIERDTVEEAAAVIAAKGASAPNPDISLPSEISALKHFMFFSSHRLPG